MAIRVLPPVIAAGRIFFVVFFEKIPKKLPYIVESYRDLSEQMDVSRKKTIQLNNAKRTVFPEFRGICKT